MNRLTKEQEDMIRRGSWICGLDSKHGPWIAALLAELDAARAELAEKQQSLELQHIDVGNALRREAILTEENARLRSELAECNNENHELRMACEARHDECDTAMELLRAAEARLSRAIAALKRSSNFHKASAEYHKPCQMCAGHVDIIEHELKELEG